MIDSPKLPGSAGEGAAGRDSHKSSRRRFIQAGITATPVIMTVISGPVLANGVGKACESPSAFASINASPHGTPATCNGVSHGYWKTHTPWPSPFSPGDLFNSVFTAGGYPGLTLDAVLNLGGGAPYEDIARNIVGALLNTAAGLNPPSVMTIALIKDIWNQYRSTGHYVSGPIDWGHDQIDAWLQSTFT